MTTEERILQYLDGSLSEQESGELMHQLSVSPEKRVVLEQHIKLSELSRVGQKPFDLPPALEARLAERLPIIAQNEEAVIGGSLLQANKFSFLHLLRVYPARFAMSAAAFLLSGAVLYWFVQSNQQVQPQSTADMQNNIQTSTQTTNSPRNSANDVASSPKVNPTTTNALPLPSNRDKSLSTTVSSTTNNLSSSTHSAQDRSIASTTRVNNNSNRNAVANQASKDNSITDVHSNNSMTNSRNTNVVNGDRMTQNTSTINSSSAQGTDIIDVPLAVVTYPTMTSTKFISSSENHSRERMNPFERKSNDERSNFAIRASYGMGETFLYVPTGGVSYTSRTESSPVIGLDYSLSPYFALGIEGGSSSILSLNSESTTETPVPGGVTRITTQSTATNSTEWFARAAVRYCINPFDRVRYECSLEGGALVSRSASPMASIQALVGYGLTEAIDVQFAALYSGVWTSSNTTTTQSTATAPDGPIVYKVVNTPASTIFSPAFTIRAGLQYRF